VDVSAGKKNPDSSRDALLLREVKGDLQTRLDYNNLLCSFIQASFAYYTLGFGALLFGGTRNHSFCVERRARRKKEKVGHFPQRSKGE